MMGYYGNPWGWQGGRGKRTAAMVISNMTNPLPPLLPPCLTHWQTSLPPAPGSLLLALLERAFPFVKKEKKKLPPSKLFLNQHHTFAFMSSATSSPSWQALPLEYLFKVLIHVYLFLKRFFLLVSPIPHLHPI